jgi:quinol---cytochrome c reductase cytochrome c subunit, bacillus type
MAVAEQAQPASRAVRARQRRAREEELLVWPDLVFIEFISAVLFLGLISVLSIMVDAVLLDQANPAVTPNPSKAPWYFLNLQELLLHMHPALAGFVVPTVALIALGAIPYFDTSNDYQGEWLSSPRAWPNLIVGALTGAIGTLLLIFYDASFQVRIFEWIANPGENRYLPGTTTDNPAFHKWPEWLNWAKSLRSLQTEVNWPSELTHIPLGSKVLRTDLLGLPAINLDVNLPAMIVEQIIPVTMMIGLPLLLSAIAWKVKLAQTKRDHMILMFSGFIAVYVTLTIIGTFFRGAGLVLEPYTIFAEH